VFGKRVSHWQNRSVFVSKKEKKCGVYVIASPDEYRGVAIPRLLTNKGNRVLYTGVTNNLIRRVWEHKEKVISGFTKKYNASKLVYYEIYEEIEKAILREKQIKAGSRKKKIDMINKMNPKWKDLYGEISE
jgi:putative endonuclease